MKTSLTPIAPLPESARPQPTSTASSARECSTVEKPSFRSVQWPRESAVALCSIRAGIRTTKTAETRNDTALIQYAASGPAAAVSTPPTTGPTAQLAFSIVWSSAFAWPEQLIRYEIRDAGVDGGPEEAGGETRDERERDDLAGRRRERQRREHAGAQQIRGDHQLPPLEPVEQRAERQPDRDRGQELDEEDAADPEAGVRPVLDVDRERNRSEKRAEARRERREEEQTEAGDAERRQLPGVAAEQSRLRVTGSSR